MYVTRTSEKKNFFIAFPESPENSEHTGTSSFSKVPGTHFFGHPTHPRSLWNDKIFQVFGPPKHVSDDQISCPQSPGTRVQCDRGHDFHAPSRLETRVQCDRGHDFHAPSRLGPGSDATGGTIFMPPVA
jgi:hypothetical protein